MTARSLPARPAILGGVPIFPSPLGIVKPVLPTLERIESPLREILASGNLTNGSRHVSEFEKALAGRLCVPSVLAVANGTLGLVLALAALGLQGEVILPAFTFSATAHALHWNRLQPVFTDILPDTFTLDPAAVAAAITPRTAALLPVHVFGQPCEVDELTSLAAGHGLALLFDSAHALGSAYRGRPVGGFGRAEVFSFHATKLLPVGEGGCVATRDPALAAYVALARKFGDPGDEDTRFPGLNAKLGEINALLGLSGLGELDRQIANRRRYASVLVERLGRLPGVTFQAARPYASTNHQNFAILIDPAGFGLSRDDLCTALLAENIHPRRYFYPPLHRHAAYRPHRSAHLPVTEQISDRVLCLPFYSEMSADLLDRLCQAVERVQRFAPRVRKVLS